MTCLCARMEGAEEEKPLRGKQRCYFLRGKMGVGSSSQPDKKQHLEWERKDTSLPQTPTIHQIQPLRPSPHNINSQIPARLAGVMQTCINVSLKHFVTLKMRNKKFNYDPYRRIIHSDPA